MERGDLMAAAVVKEELSSSSESDEEEWRWHGSGGDDDDSNEATLEGMEEKDEDGEGAMKKRLLKRERENKWYGQRAEIRRRLLAGEDPPEVDEELKKKILKQWERRKEYDRRRREREREGKSKEGKIKREFKGRGPRKRKYPDLTPEEQRKMRREKDKFRLLEKKLNMTEEEREEDKRRKYFQMEAWRAKLSKEEREEMRRRQSEREKRRYEEKSEEEKRRMVERHKGWRRNLSEEKKRRYLEGVYKCIKRNNERKKREDPEGWRRKMRERGKMQWGRMKEEDKERRKKMMKLYQWKKRFRGELEGMGEEREVIERRVKEEEERKRQEWEIGPPRSKGNFKRKWEGNKIKEKEGMSPRIDEVVEVDQWRGKEEEPRKSARLENKVELNFEVDGGGDQFFDDYEPPPILGEEMEVSSSSMHSLVPLNNATVTKIVPVSEPPGLLAPKMLIGTVTETIVQDGKMKTFLCEFCPRSTSLAGGEGREYFGGEQELKLHLKAKHLASCWKCPICFEVVLAPEQLSEHFAAVHRKASEKTEIKIKSEGVQEKVDKEEKKISCEDKANGTFLCMKCPWQQENNLKINKVFKSWSELHSHVKKKHRKYYWPCKHCHILKYSKERFKLHQKICKK